MREVLVCNDYKNLVFKESELIRLFHFLDTLNSYSLSEGELSIALVDDQAIAKLHDEFMGDPTETDVITFPGDASHFFAGEICVSVDQAQQCSKELGVKFSEEITLYLIHGWLHLAGYDDLDPVHEKQMRAAEQEVMAKLKERALIPEFKILKQF